MTLFNAKDAINQIKDAKADKLKKLNRFQQLVSDNHVLRDENARLRAKVNQHESRIASLEGFQSDQESWNTEAQQRVGKLQRQSASTGLSAVGGRACPECGEAYPEGVAYWPGYTSTSHPGDPRCCQCFPKDADG